jgi:hypothetical protein
MAAYPLITRGIARPQAVLALARGVARKYRLDYSYIYVL